LIKFNISTFKQCFKTPRKCSCPSTRILQACAEFVQIARWSTQSAGKIFGINYSQIIGPYSVSVSDGSVDMQYVKACVEGVKRLAVQDI